MHGSGDAAILEENGLKTLRHFDGARAHAAPRRRLEAVRAASRALREDLLRGPEVLYYRSFPLVRVPYPARYALLNACGALTPYVHLLNRLFVVQYRAAGRVRTLLASPSDVDANAQTPFFRALVRRFGPIGPAVRPILAPRYADVEQCLRSIGLAPAEVDYISYDHLHTQDLRRWLGDASRPGYFPNAKLLIMRQEWESARGLLPPQETWYCPSGVDGIDPARVLLLDGDVSLGDGAVLMRTPGHTEGNHSFVFHAGGELFVTSENGVGADAYAPLSSGISGVRRYARDTGMEVVLNGNTLEGGLDQYISMVQEKEVAGPCRAAPAFYNVFPSSELAAYALFPGVSPTFSFGEAAHGKLRR